MLKGLQKHPKSICNGVNVEKFSCRVGIVMAVKVDEGTLGV
jgi:hypothetical protein